MAGPRDPDRGAPGAPQLHRRLRGQALRGPPEWSRSLSPGAGPAQSSAPERDGGIRAPQRAHPVERAARAGRPRAGGPTPQRAGGPAGGGPRALPDTGRIGGRDPAIQHGPPAGRARGRRPGRCRRAFRRGDAERPDGGRAASRRSADRGGRARSAALRLARAAAADGPRAAPGRGGAGGARDRQCTGAAARRRALRAGSPGAGPCAGARGRRGPGLSDHRRRRAAGDEAGGLVGGERGSRDGPDARPRARSRLMGDTYTASDIKVLEGLEAFRKRPAMYIGDTVAYGLHPLVYEAVDNSVDEALGGYCDSIKVILHSDGSCSVGDNGRGIPVDTHKETGKSAAEVVLTVLHAGGKFEHSAYKVSGGLHGVGISVVNALSEWLDLEIRREGKVWTQRYEYGAPQGDLAPGEKTSKHGTFIRFKPDSKIFEETAFSFDTLSNRLRELAFLNKGLKIVIEDERDERR